MTTPTAAPIPAGTVRVMRYTSPRLPFMVRVAMECAIRDAIRDAIPAAK